jgi:amidohydrolase
MGMTTEEQDSRIPRLKAKVCENVDARRDELVSVSLDIHRNPEVAFTERHASRLLASHLQAAGHSVDHPAFGMETALSCDIGHAGLPCVGLVGEYDALPEIGHACGHNIIGTAAMGAALALADLGANLPGRVRFIGTPAEESGGGKIILARKGAFEDLECVLMVHPADRNLPTFPIIARAAARAVFHGRPSHAAAGPEHGINALDALVTAYNAIAAWRQQLPHGCRIHAIITEGGVATNVIPERTAGEFVIRAPDRIVLEDMRARLNACLEAGALAAGAKVDIAWDENDYHELVTNWPLAKAYRSNAERLGRRFDEMADLPFGFAASTDFGNVSHLVPAIHPMIQAMPRGTEFHTLDFARGSASDAGMDALIDSAKSMAMTAIDFMCDGNLRAAVVGEFAAGQKGHRK